MSAESWIEVLKLLGGTVGGGSVAGLWITWRGRERIARINADRDVKIARLQTRGGGRQGRGT